MYCDIQIYCRALERRSIGLAPAHVQLGRRRLPGLALCVHWARLQVRSTFPPSQRDAVDAIRDEKPRRMHEWEIKGKKSHAVVKSDMKTFCCYIGNPNQNDQGRML